MQTFGKKILENPVEMSGLELQELLSQHGVIAFYGHAIADSLSKIMESIGPLQNWIEQQAPEKYTDKTNKNLINLFNDDFLGTSRMGWHTDQTYLKNSYLPIRSLYTPIDVTPGNITSFADLSYITDYILNEYPELSTEKGRYFIGAKKPGAHSTVRPLLSYCKHLDKNIFRLDSRMELINQAIDKEKFSNLIKQAIDQAPKFDVEWTKNILVIFDNNRSLHRRSQMAGNCHMQRYTSKFWLND
jgi:alpha-ketoglutarate-dependent taurine dioxygenase